MKEVMPSEYAAVGGAFSWPEFGVVTGSSAVTGAVVGVVIGTLTGSNHDKVGHALRWALMLGVGCAVIGASLDVAAQVGCASCAHECHCNRKPGE